MADDWQIGCKDIKMRVVNLYNSEFWPDCKFLVKGTMADQSVMITAHKLVLAIASPVFSAMFFGEMSETSDQICIQDIEPDTFNKMLRYIYTDNIDLSSFVDGCALYYAAKKYMLQHLMTQCSTYLLSKLTAKDCCYGYEFAKMFDEKTLLEACLKLMENNTSIVLTDGLKDASLDTLKMIFSLEKITVSSEMELFKAVQHYVEMHQMQEDGKHEKLIRTISVLHDRISKKENGTEEINIPHGNFENDGVSNPSNVSSKGPTAIIDLLRLIRFLTMEPEEFSKGPAASPLLSQTEKFNILINISNPNTDLPMPEGFTTSRFKRNKHTLVPVDKNRKSCSFTFMVPQCKCLNFVEFVNDIICSPWFFVISTCWRIDFELVENNWLSVSISHHGLKQPVDVTLKLGLISKTHNKYFKEFSFRMSSYHSVSSKRCLVKIVIGYFVDWSNAINNYMDDDGCLHFEVSFKIQ